MPLDGLGFRCSKFQMMGGPVDVGSEVVGDEKTDPESHM